jgi:hypothetical protein
LERRGKVSADERRGQAPAAADAAPHTGLGESGRVRLWRRTGSLYRGSCSGKDEAAVRPCCGGEAKLIEAIRHSRVFIVPA